MTEGAAEGAPIVRDAVAADLGAIQGIYAHHVCHGLASFETEPPDVGEMGRRREALVNAGLPYLAAEREGRVEGFAYAAPYRPRAAYRYTVESSVYVAPDAGGRGTGTALLGRLVEVCAARGYRQMVAVIGDSANLASIRLHERLGFRRAGVLAGVGYKHGHWVDTLLMQRPLGPGEELAPEATGGGRA